MNASLSNRIPRIKNRLLAAMRWDVQLQVQYGFYYAGAFVALAWIALLSSIPRETLARLMPIFIMGGMNITTFYFIAGQILFEKGEGTIEALIITPMRVWEYLASKAITLTVLAMLENLLIVALTYGFGFNALLLVIGMVLLGIIYALTGFIAVARYDSINRYLIPSMGYVLLLMLPVFEILGVWQSWLFYLHPVYAPLVLLKSAFVPAEPWQIVYGVLYSMIWIGLIYGWANRTFHNFIIRKDGLK